MWGGMEIYCDGAEQDEKTEEKCHRKNWEVEGIELKELPQKVRRKEEGTEEDKIIFVESDEW